MLYFSYWRCVKKWPRIRVAQECVCTNRLATSSYQLMKKNNASKDVLYVPAPDRLEYCTCHRTRFYGGHYQPWERSSPRMVHLRATWNRGLLAFAALLWEAAARRAPAPFSSALGLTP